MMDMAESNADKDELRKEIESELSDLQKEAEHEPEKARKHIEEKIIQILALLPMAPLFAMFGVAAILKGVAEWDSRVTIELIEKMFSTLSDKRKSDE